MTAGMGEKAPARPAAGQRWSARAAFTALLGSVLVLVASEGPIGLTLLSVGLGGAAAILAGGFWFLAKRGIRRWIGLAVVVIAVALIVVIFFRANVAVVALISLGLLALGAAAAGNALWHAPEQWMPVATTAPPSKPFIVMNPRSGGGKVVRFDLPTKARALGAEVALLDGPGYVDVAGLVRDAIAGGADLLGVAGGDGTQALVAGIAAEHNIPLLVISAGTRNHFALDLGLDRDDPSTCLQALTDGEEVRVDLGMIGDRPFVNNASFGAYAEIVQSPEYRDNKNHTMLEMLPDLLSGPGGANLTVRTGDPHPERVAGRAGQQQPLRLRSPPGHGPPGPAGPGHPRNRRRAAVLCDPGRRPAPNAQHRSITSTTADSEVIIDADASTIPVGIDGEAVTIDTPVHCTIRPRALRVLLPRTRPVSRRHRPGSTGKVCGRLQYHGAAE